jgi:hypothetical protein
VLDETKAAAALEAARARAAIQEAESRAEEAREAGAAEAARLKGELASARAAVAEADRLRESAAAQAQRRMELLNAELLQATRAAAEQRRRHQQEQQRLHETARHAEEARQRIEREARVAQAATQTAVSGGGGNDSRPDLAAAARAAASAVGDHLEARIRDLAALLAPGAGDDRLAQAAGELERVARAASDRAKEAAALRAACEDLGRAHDAACVELEASQRRCEHLQEQLEVHAAAHDALLGRLRAAQQEALRLREEDTAAVDRAAAALETAQTSQAALAERAREWQDRAAQLESQLDEERDERSKAERRGEQVRARRERELADQVASIEEELAQARRKLAAREQQSQQPQQPQQPQRLEPEEMQLKPPPEPRPHQVATGATLGAQSVTPLQTAAAAIDLAAEQAASRVLSLMAQELGASHASRSSQLGSRGANGRHRHRKHREQDKAAQRRSGERRPHHEERGRNNNYERSGRSASRHSSDFGSSAPSEGSSTESRRDGGHERRGSRSRHRGRDRDGRLARLLSESAAEADGAAQVARAMRERDIQVALLQRQIDAIAAAQAPAHQTRPAAN